MPNYGRCPNQLTKTKPSYKSSKFLKRGKIIPAWNAGLEPKKRNPSMYVNLFRNKVTPYSAILPPNMKFRLKTFQLNLRQLAGEDIILRRPNQGPMNIKISVLQCLGIYERIRERLSITDVDVDDEELDEEEEIDGTLTEDAAIEEIEL